MTENRSRSQPEMTRREAMSWLGLSIAGLPGMTEESRGRNRRLQPYGGHPEPERNESWIGAYVLSHSGEFSPEAKDFTLPGRGNVEFGMVRKYRSELSTDTGDFGRGWTFSYSKYFEWSPPWMQGDLLYHDGRGKVHQFIRRSEDRYTHPLFYAELVDQGEQFVLEQRRGRNLFFEKPDQGGRILRFEDRNGNSFDFTYNGNKITVTDPFDREIEITYEDSLIREITDYSGRAWTYNYNESDCLTSVERPDGQSITYTYDEKNRLETIGPPEGEVLSNTYDEQGRITEQQHGSGIYGIEYERTDGPDSPYVTHLTRRGETEATVHLLHNETGQVTERTVEVSADLVDADPENEQQERVSLVTSSKYNDFGEVVSREYPSGNITEWTYDEENSDPRARGNLLKRVDHGAPDVNGDHETVTRTYTYDADHQRPMTFTDERGNTVTHRYDENGNLIRKTYPETDVYDIDAHVEEGLTEDGPMRTEQLFEEYEYNQAGQLIRLTDTGGNVTEFFYYPETDPGGTEGTDDIHNDPDRRGGFRARLERDPNDVELPDRLEGWEAEIVSVEYRYDQRGNVLEAWDGRGNSKQFEYNALGNTTMITARDGTVIDIERDGNQNIVEESITFDRYEYDPDDTEFERVTSTLKTCYEYDPLNNLVEHERFSTETDESLKIELIRDERENIVERIRPAGNRETYSYDERDQLVERTWAPGTEDETTFSYTYTRGGKTATVTDGRDNQIQYRYDNLRRHVGTVYPDGTLKERTYNAAGQLTEELIREAVEEEEVRRDGDDQADVLNNGGCVASGMAYGRDAMGRCNRVSGTSNASAGDGCGARGESNWDGAEGEVSKVVEFDKLSQPSKVWNESGNIERFTRDGMGRIIETLSTGGFVRYQFDANSNPERIVSSVLGIGILNPIQPTPIGTASEDKSETQDVTSNEHPVQVIETGFDEMDRPIFRNLNDEPKRFWEYNGMGQLLSTEDIDGTKQIRLHDGFARGVGSVIPLEGQEGQITNQYELDDNANIVEHTDPAGYVTEFRYDSLDRREAIQYPDETTATFGYDGNGNLERLVDRKGNEIDHFYDGRDRLIQREIDPVDDTATVESYEYDAAGRMTAATRGDIETTFTHDSIGRTYEETQNGRTITYDHDNVGNVTDVFYPGGAEIHRRFDAAGRISVALNEQGEQIADYTYNDGGRLDHKVIGEGEGVMTASYTYNEACGGCLSELRFENAAGDLVGGHSYVYNSDDTLRETEELFYSEVNGRRFGTRYAYDGANRVDEVRYGADLDEETDFVHEVQYDRSLVGTIGTKTVVDNNQEVVTELGTSTDLNHEYVEFGQREFSYDANANREWESGRNEVVDIGQTWLDESTVAERASAIQSSDCDEWEYDYDYDNRLVGARCYDAEGTLLKELSYEYDALGRLITRDVVDRRSGTEASFTYVWMQNRLIEIRMDGEPFRTYIYGDTELVKMRDYTGGTATVTGQHKVSAGSDDTDTNEDEEDDSEDCYFTFTGTDITGCVDEDGNIAEKYRFDVNGQPYPTVVDGEPVETFPVVDDILTDILDKYGTGILDKDIHDNGREFGIDGTVWDRQPAENQNRSRRVIPISIDVGPGKRMCCATSPSEWEETGPDIDVTPTPEQQEQKATFSQIAGTVVATGSAFASGGTSAALQLLGGSLIVKGQVESLNAGDNDAETESNQGETTSNQGGTPNEDSGEPDSENQSGSSTGESNESNSEDEGDDGSDNSDNSDDSDDSDDSEDSDDSTDEESTSESDDTDENDSEGETDDGDGDDSESDSSRPAPGRGGTDPNTGSNPANTRDNASFTKCLRNQIGVGGGGGGGDILGSPGLDKRSGVSTSYCKYAICGHSAAPATVSISGDIQCSGAAGPCSCASGNRGPPAAPSGGVGGGSGVVDPGPNEAEPRNTLGCLGGPSGGQG